MKAALILALSFTLACGSSEDSTAPVADTTSGAEATDTSETTGLARLLSPLVVAPITLTDAQGAAVRVDANGQLSMDGQEGAAPVFSPSGEITMQGQTLATISAEGILRTAAGQVLAVIGPDGAADVGGLNLTFAADGTLAGANAAGPITLMPADSPARRLAMSVIILMLSASPPEPTDNVGPTIN